MSTLAGLFGPEGMTYPDHSAAINTPFEVQTPSGSVAEIWLDENKIAYAPNPRYTDGLGNLWFFADPGPYNLVRDGEVVLSIAVPRNPAEEISAEDKEEIIVEVLADLEPEVDLVVLFENGLSQGM